MPANVLTDMLGEILVGGVSDGLLRVPANLSTAQRVLLAATAVAAFALGGSALALVGLPAVPGISALLLAQSWYAWPAATSVLVLLTLLARPIVGRVRFDAPVFCAACGLLVLPVRGGDARNALLDAGSAGVYVKMAVEQALLAGSLLLAYAALYRRPVTAAEGASGEIVDTANDRLWTIGMQAALMLALLGVLALSPLKGQVLLSAALAGGVAAAVTHKSYRVHGSIWYAAGTMLCGLIAYAWTYLHPDGVRLGDVAGLLAGPARVLPLHYATAGIAGTIYGCWLAQIWAGEAVEA